MSTQLTDSHGFCGILMAFSLLRERIMGAYSKS